MNYKFCPKCGASLIRVMEHEYSRLQCSSCKFVFYQNSKPTASALIIDEDKVLLGRRNIEPSKGMWDIPGGFLEPGEHPEDGMRREIMEETGLQVKIVDMLGFIMDDYGEDKQPTLNICYIVKKASETERPGDDLEELKWFKISELPEEIAFKNGHEMLEKLREYLSGPNKL